MVRRPMAVGDELWRAAEQMLIDGVERDRMSRSHALIVQARREYRTALDNAALLCVPVRRGMTSASSRRITWRWWAATGLATYRCGPTVEDVAALLTELQELGRLLLSGTADDRDAIQLQVGLLAAIVDRLGADKCVRQSLRAGLPVPSRRLPGRSSRCWPRCCRGLRTAGICCSILPTRKRCVLRLRRRSSPVRRFRRRTMSLRDWHYLRTSAGFQLDLARLAAAGLPDARTILEPLETGFEAAQRQQSAILENRDAHVR